ncbi:hypothetical protein HRI_001919100 [Hibiscus trionum]|uniref:Uncharacterized protein n=1 Tax=Hibiscus trionum TaxID=183268 RepID=A0A9W7HS40_HIBTR|nr:hypothetical protein HRI_001919100 [Hibiscus trionum]
MSIQHSFSQSSSPIYSLPHSNVTLFSPPQLTAAGGNFYRQALASPPCTCNSFETTVSSSLTEPILANQICRCQMGNAAMTRPRQLSNWIAPRIRSSTMFRTSVQ